MDKHKAINFILASGSPRRKQLLENIGLTPLIIIPDIDELLISEIAPQEASRLSKLKAKKIFLKLEQKSWVLAADTLVYQKNKIMGKPNNETEAKEMLIKLSGKKHKVVTGFCLISPEGRITQKRVISTVKMILISKQILQHYLSTKEWEGVSGAYRIQEKGNCLIANINGSLTNIIGLPMERLIPVLCKQKLLP